MKRWRARLTLAAISSAALTSLAASADDCSRLTFTDVTSELGITFTHDRGASGLKHFPETMGAGLAWLDFDGDGWQDLYLVQSGHFPPPVPSHPHGMLLRNLQGEDFEEVTFRSAAAHTGYGQGVLASDLDGDGAVDLLITTFGENQLLLNTGSGAFREASENLTGAEAGWSSSAATADADLDGDLDLYISQYVVYDPAAPIFCGDPQTGVRRYCDPSIFAGARDLYLENQGNGRFEEVGESVGLASADGRGLGVLFVDLDDNLHPEIYVANDLTPNSLFRNRGDGRFEDVSLLSGAAVNREGKPEAGMGLALGDQNTDLLPDLLVTNFDVETNTYYEASGDLSFLDLSAASGLGSPSFNFLAFGIVTADLDGDADLDVYIATGHIFERPRRDNIPYRQRDQILLGDGRGHFEELRCSWLDTRVNVSRGLAMADFDNDGDVDLASQESGGPASLLRNDTGPADWLGMVLRGNPGNTEAIGARAVLRSDDISQTRWVIAGDSYQSTSDRRILFSMPDHDGGAAVELRWPTGRRVRLLRPNTGRYFVFAER